MPFITQGKTNWKFLLIVIILAIIVGGGAFILARRQFPIISPFIFPKSCRSIHDGIEKEFEEANFCNQDSDCKTMSLGGQYITFGCYKFVNKSTNEQVLYDKMEKYYQKCSAPIDECAPTPESVCVNNKCTKKTEDETTKKQACINSGGTVKTGTCGNPGDFPNNCAIGACLPCYPEECYEVKVCICGEGKCFDGEKCIEIQEGKEEISVTLVNFLCDTKDEGTQWDICKAEDDQFEFEKPNDFFWVKNIAVIPNCNYETFQEKCPRFDDLILAFEKKRGCNESCLKAMSSNLSSWGDWSRVIIEETPFCVYKTCDCGAGSCGCTFYHTAIQEKDCYIIYSQYSRVNCSSVYGPDNEDSRKCIEKQKDEDQTFEEVISTFRFLE